MTSQNTGFGETPSSRLDSHRNSVQNGIVDSSGHFTGTIFVNFFDFSKIDQKSSEIVRKKFAESVFSTHFKGPGAFPSSRLDSHRNFGRFCLGYVDFRQFPTRFAPILMFSTDPEVGDHFLCPQGARRVNHPRWGTTFGVLRVPDEATTQKSSNVLSRLQKFPGTVDFTMGF